MKTFSKLFLILSSFFFVGGQVLAEKPVKKLKKFWGEKITLKKEVPLSVAVENEALSSGKKEILLTGVAAKICKKKGCWMIIEDKGRSTRVTFKDYGFFVDDSLVGKKILAQGFLKKKLVSKKDAVHYLVDEGMDPAKAEKVGKEKLTYTFVASGVKIQI